MRGRRFLLLLLVLAGAMCLWLYAFASERSITINPGKQLHLGGIKDVIAAFEDETGIPVSIPKVGGCGDSVKGVSSGKLDAGALCCPANREETGKLGFVDAAIARDALVFVVHKNVPVDSLSTQQLRDIYQGRIKNWNEVGGPDAPIKPYAHIMCGNREEVMRQFLVGERDYKKGTVGIDNRRFAPWVRNIKDETDVCKTVASDPYAIAPVSRSMVQSNVKVIAVDGIEPTQKSIKNETYPVVRYLHIITKGYPSGATKQFINFLRSPRGRQLLAMDGKVLPLP